MVTELAATADMKFDLTDFEMLRKIMNHKISKLPYTWSTILPALIHILLSA